MLSRRTNCKAGASTFRVAPAFPGHAASAGAEPTIQADQDREEMSDRMQQRAEERSAEAQREREAERENARKLREDENVMLCFKNENERQQKRAHL